MYIEKINGPDDVKKIEVSELPKLAEEMRHALLIRASKHWTDISGRISVWWRQRSRFIMCLIRRKIKLYFDVVTPELST